MFFHIPCGVAVAIAPDASNEVEVRIEITIGALQQPVLSAFGKRDG